MSVALAAPDRIKELSSPVVDKRFIKSTKMKPRCGFHGKGYDLESPVARRVLSRTSSSEAEAY